MGLKANNPQQFTASKFFNPDEDFNPNAPPAPAPQPQPGDIARAAAPDPTVAPPLAPAPNPMASPEDFMRANTPARPAGDFDTGKHPALRRGLAAAFAGLAEYGGDQNGHPGAGSHFFDRWANQDEAQRQYDANQGRNQATARVQGSAEQLGQANTAATTAHTRAETEIIGQNLPAQEQAQKAYDKLKDMWVNKSTPDFDKAAAAELNAMPANISRMVRPHVQEIKGLAQTGKGYQLTMQDDLPKSVNVYGKEYDRNDPQLETIAPGAAADFDRAMSAHTTKLSEAENKDKRVAGYAADRQAQGFVHADQARTATESFQNQEKGKAEAAKHLQTLREAQNQNELVQQLASSKSPTDQTSLAFKALGLDLPDGVHRINETELNAIANQGSLSDRAKKAILGWTTGQKFAPNILEDIKQTANKIAASKMKTANDNLEDVNRNFGYRVQGADERGRFDGEQQQNFTPETHQFSVSAWQKANPRGDVNAAKAAAQRAHFHIVP